MKAPSIAKCLFCGDKFDRGGTRALYCTAYCCSRAQEYRRRKTEKRRRQNRESQQRWRDRQKEKRQA
jgi:hypothetical protein